MKVLVVDDSKLARMAMAKVLKAVRSGWETIEAPNADDALARVQDSAIDIAVLDFNMPGRDGLSLAAEIREVNPFMPVAIISANHQQEVVDRARALGATFLPKPLSEEALQEFLATAEEKLKVPKA